MSRWRMIMPMRVVFCASLMVTAFSAWAEDEPAALKCTALEAVASPQCARLLQKASELYNAALAFERMGNRKIARDTYSQVVPAKALLRRGMMHRELGELSEAMADFTALIDADWATQTRAMSARELFSNLAD